MKILGAHSLEPTAQERAKERSVIYSIVADGVMVGLQVLFAVVTGSLTLLSEAVRSIMMLVIEFYSLWLMGGIHRGRLQHFQFGIGKIEQFAWLIIGAGLVVSGLWVASKVVDSITTIQFVPSPLGLASAAVVNAINLMVNGFSFYAMIISSEENDSEIFTAQIRARALKLANSVFLQITLTIAALASDPLIALVMDGIGATFVACLMVVTGFSMVTRSLPDMLDAPIDGSLQDEIAAAIEATSLSPEDIVQIRTRRSGRFPQVELTLAAKDGSSIAALQEKMRELRAKVAEIDDQISLVTVIADGEPS